MKKFDGDRKDLVLSRKWWKIRAVVLWVLGNCAHDEKIQMTMPLPRVEAHIKKK